jgi:hypothetical protein
MRCAAVIASIALTSLNIGALASSGFDVKSGGSCSSHEPWHDDKMTLKRGFDGAVRARIVYHSACIMHEEGEPDVDYLEGSVQIRVPRDFNEITFHCSCTQKLTFTLKRAVPPGTVVLFGFNSDEPLLRAIAP